MEVTEIKEKKLKTILRFSIPSIIAMLLETAITVTDGYFTGNYVGQDALAAINLGLPILYFYLGIGLCIGVGGSVICGKLLGAKDRRKASEVFSQTALTAVALCVLLSLAVLLLFSPILILLRADGNLSVYFTQYYRVMLVTYPLMVMSTILSMFIRLDGKPQICMAVSIVSCLLNVILDYIISLLRGIVLLLAFVIIFPSIWGMTGVWMAAPATEALTAIVSVLLIKKQKKKLEGR